MLELKNISKNYGEKKVLENFSLSIEKNQILVILGASGSGKTTLLNIIASLTDSGGEIINKPDKVSYIFQNDRLLDNLTVEQNITLIADSSAAAAVLKKVEMYESRNLYIRQLSGGMRRRVAIARAFAYDAKLLLMDEPFSSLDFGLKMRLIEVFKKLYDDSPKTAVLVTHEIDEAIILADRIIVLDNSQIIYDFKKQADTNLDKLRAELVKVMTAL